MKLTVKLLSEIKGVEITDEYSVLDEFKKMEIEDVKVVNNKVVFTVSKNNSSFENNIWGGKTMCVEFEGNDVYDVTDYKEQQYNLREMVEAAEEKKEETVEEKKEESTEEVSEIKIMMANQLHEVEVHTNKGVETYAWNYETHKEIEEKYKGKIVYSSLDEKCLDYKGIKMILFHTSYAPICYNCVYPQDEVNFDCWYAVYEDKKPVTPPFTELRYEGGNLYLYSQKGKIELSEFLNK